MYVCVRERERTGRDRYVQYIRITCARRLSPPSPFEEFKVVSQTGRDYGCGICICHTRQLQPGYFRRARAESTNTHTYTRVCVCMRRGGGCLRNEDQASSC